MLKAKAKINRVDKPLMALSLPWTRAWVTGAGRGIGKALTLLLCAQGVDVYASARSKSDLLKLEKECEGLVGRCIISVLDITQVPEIDDLVLQWNKHDAWPDLFVLNAGTHDPFSAYDFDAQRCQRLLDVNLQGTINCLDPLLKRCIEVNTGHIAVMASVAGYRGLPTAAAYGASKAALINLTESLHADLYKTDIVLQVINPGFVRTPLTDKNDFKMPALMEVDAAATRLLKGLLSSSFELSFPRRFVLALKLLRLLPDSWYFSIVSRLVL
ncbi:SDR family NAD(P)-dependent oxidoreductase [Agaribacterium sp. ZY112]|uniref:SDR family NAD(P)-dependent oxidoreductase n=1 Tax=Agaribacterium sp. ZY112 TaxID=3233574 RepID=UPI0035256BCD